MTHPHGHPLGSVAATLALSDWERRTALAAPDYDPDDTDHGDPGADLAEQKPDDYEVAEGRLRAMDYDAWADL